MIGLDLLGAGEGLSTQTIMLRIRKIDPDKLRRTVTEKTWGAVIPFAVSIADGAPKLALSTVFPVAKKQLEEIGITADLATTESPPPPNPPYEGLKLLGVGTVVGFVVALVARSLYTLARGRS